MEGFLPRLDLPRVPVVTPVLVAICCLVTRVIKRKTYHVVAAFVVLALVRVNPAGAACIR